MKDYMTQEIKRDKETKHYKILEISLDEKKREI